MILIEFSSPVIEFNKFSLFFVFLVQIRRLKILNKKTDSHLSRAIRSSLRAAQSLLAFLFVACSSLAFLLPLERLYVQVKIQK